VITPFRIDIPQAALDDLSDRLARTRWPAELAGDGWEYGIPQRELTALVDYWRTGYDWREQEALLNKIPQFTAVIDGTTVHFLHIRSAAPDALPLILTHGWPGSIVEFLDVIAPLSEHYHLVIPSIPGFGFSSPATTSGWTVRRIATAWAELMARLGYDRYGAQGGDWGFAISRDLAVVAPENVVGVHLNYLPTPPAGDLGDLSDQDRSRVTALQDYLANRTHQQKIMATHAHTFAYALTDSPAGQLAWIAHKFTEWSDPASPIPVDRLLTNTMLYWLTATASSVARLYHANATRIPPEPFPAPVGVSVFPHDLALPARPLAERTYNITHWTEHPRGGHFAALEAPDLLAADIHAFFSGLQ
jgi:pimeloyl-ACP methyl ester carboxylesterase